MIIHRYSEYEEPQEPPFTLTDVVRAASDLMLRYHLDFNQALKYLLDQGLPINEFLRSENFDSILDDYISEVKRMKDEFHKTWDIKNFIRQKRKNLDSVIRRSGDALGGDPETTGAVKEAARNRSESRFYRLIGAAKQLLPSRDRDLFLEAVSEGATIAAILANVESFDDRFGKRFYGDKTPTDDEAQTLVKQYESLEELGKQLVDAKERGDLFGVDDKKLKETLGDQRYEEFKNAREEILSKLAELMKQEGVATREDDGIFKLTPAAARKMGERTLAQLFENLTFDGSGGHRVDTSDDGSVATEKTRAYEYGDTVAHIDVAETMVNAMQREGVGLPINLKLTDFVIHETVGTARTAIVVMIDMSGSMSRFGRFYNAKKMALAFDALVRKSYPEDAVHFIGFATFASRIMIGDVLALGPEPITMSGGGVNMKIDWSKIRDHKKELAHVPRYFTNMQKGLELARRLLTAERGENKEIIMITDGAPTAHYEGRYLYLNYPPTERAFAATLKEARACTEAGIRINAFMLGADFDTGFFGEGDFIKRMMEINRGRLFHPEPDSLTRYVLTDYVANKKKMFEV